MEQLERHGPAGAWIVDDTGISKTGSYSVGVTRRYRGALGKQDNCQVAVTVSLANDTMSVPCAYRLYVPEAWARDQKRRRVAGIPKDVAFATRWAIALAAIDRMLAEDLSKAPVVTDAGYGVVTAFRDGLTHRGMSYVVGITAETSVWSPGQAPLSPKRWSGRGRPTTRVRRTARHRPLPAGELGHALSARSWRTVRWREGTQGTMQSRFAAVRVRPAHRDNQRSEPRDPEWLVIEWPPTETKPTKYWLSTLPEQAGLDDLVRLAKIRWRIERDFEAMKNELGLDHDEGRGWLGFPPQKPLAFLRPARVPRSFQPRGASATS